MARHKEIETKWNAESVKKEDFAKNMRKYLKDNSYSFTDLQVGGYDYYYRSKGGYVLRHRTGADSNELTVKARIKSNSIKIRKEVNVKISEEATPLDVSAMFKLLGFKQEFAIYKSCDILFVKDKNAEVSIVWYKVTKSGDRLRTFMEVEVDWVPQKESVRILNKWTKIVEHLFKLGPEHVSPDSLYEIFSGKRYRKV